MLEGHWGAHIHGVEGIGNQLSPRLDRFLVLKAWENHFSNPSQSCSRRDEKKENPFRSENMRLKVEGFKKQLKCQTLSFLSIIVGVQTSLCAA